MWSLFVKDSAMSRSYNFESALYGGGSWLRSEEMKREQLSCLRELRTYFGCVSLYFKRCRQRYRVDVECLVRDSADDEFFPVFIILKVLYTQEVQ